MHRSRGRRIDIDDVTVGNSRGNLVFQLAAVPLAGEQGVAIQPVLQLMEIAFRAINTHSSQLEGVIGLGTERKLESQFKPFFRINLRYSRKLTYERSVSFQGEAIMTDTS